MYEQERATFAALKQALEKDTELRSNVEAAFQDILSCYSTTIYENRFIVGGVTEIILVAAFGAIGLPAQHVAQSSTREDIIFSNGSRFSVKGRHSRKARTFNLINTQSEAEVFWNTATLFPVSEYGLIYANAELLPDVTERTGDALILKWRDLQRFAEAHPEYVARFKIPFSSTTEVSEVASRDIAEKILQSKPRLKDHLPLKEKIK